MIRYLATVDAGTTNTRASLWSLQGVGVDAVSRNVGVRDTAIDGHNQKLRTAVRDCLAELAAKHGLGEGGLAAVYASGMITSNVGLFELPHLVAPAAKEDFIRGVRPATLPDVCRLPINFIPGLKNMAGGVTMANLEAMDIMRGEEVEALALMEFLPAGREYLVVLPGSHSKFVRIDARGRLTGCLTSIAGELLDCLTTQSILAEAVGRAFVSAESYRREIMLAGFAAARETSFARAAFLTRTMKMFVDPDPAHCANFLLGAVLANDVSAVRASSALRAGPEVEVVIAGREPLRSALADAFREDGRFNQVRVFVPPDNLQLSGYGAYLLAKARENW